MSTTAPPVDPALLGRVRAVLASEREAVTPARVADALRRTGVVLGDSTVLAVTGSLQAELSGAGPLESLLHQPGVSDVLVNGCDGVWVDRGAGLERSDVRLSGEGAVRALAVRLAAAAGRRLDDAQPWVDARLADGTRLHAVLAPLAAPGTCLSLRVPAARRFSLEDLAAAGSLAAPLVPLLDRLVAVRRSFLITGGTGTGKTTVLAALLSRVGPAERIVIVEDSAELRPDHHHVVRLEARPANVDGAGAVILRDLVRQALRMRPDRLVVGEVRGGEVVELLAALNTGHDGGCGTLHANDAAALPARVEALAVAAGLPRQAAHSQLAAALDVVVHLARDREGRRRVAELAVPLRRPDGLVEVVPAVTVGADDAVGEGPGAARLERLLADRDG